MLPLGNLYSDVLHDDQPPRLPIGPAPLWETRTPIQPRRPAEGERGPFRGRAPLPRSHRGRGLPSVRALRELLDE